MRFYKILFTLTAVLSAVGVNARQMFIGNLLPDNRFSNTGIVMNDTTASAVLVTPDDMRNMKGANLKSVAAYYNDLAKPKYFKVFVSRHLGSDIIFEKVLNPDSVSKGWNTVELDIPYQISSDSLYIGCLIHASRMGMAAKNDSPVKSFYRKRSTGSWVETTGIGVYGIVEGDNLPANDAELSLIEKGMDALSEEAFDVQLLVSNQASDTIRSLELTCEFADGTKTKYDYSDLGIAYLKTDTIEVKDIKLKEVKAHNLKFTISKVNGEEDFDTSNNTQIFKVSVFADIVTRKVMVELFSTERCTGCPGGHDKLQRAINGNENIIEVGHHTGFYTDKWSLPGCEEYNFFYQVVTTFAPAAMIDRTCMSRYGAKNPYEGGENSVVFGIEGTDDLYSLFQVALAKPAEAKIKLNVKYQDSKLAIDVEGKALSEVENDSRLTVYVTEDNLFTETQAGSVGNYYQHAVNRAYVSDQWGDPVDVNAGFKKQYTVDVKSDWNVNNLNVIAFVHNSSDDKNTVLRAQGFNIYNAEKVQVKPHEVDVDEIESAPVAVVSRPDGLIEIIGDYQYGKIYSINGVEVCTMRGSPVVSAALADGIYVVELVLPDGGLYRTKVII